MEITVRQAAAEDLPQILALLADDVPGRDRTGGRSNVMVRMLLRPGSDSPRSG
jgi:hypothetical protein